MLQIQKYSLRLDDSDRDMTRFSVAKNSDLLSVKKQGDFICFWFLADLEKEEEYREFKILGTGFVVLEEFVYLHKFICTVLDSEFVWHVYEKIK